jgi:hypothetical protein
MREIINTNQKYRIVSMKHTHKKDKFITLWGPNNAGYHWSKEMSGVYEGYEPGYHESERNTPITEELAESLFTKANHEGKEKHMILNTISNAKKLGLKWIKGELTREGGGFTMSKTTENALLWIFAFMIGTCLTILFLDKRELNVLAKEKLNLENEKLRIEIQILEVK